MSTLLRAGIGRAMGLCLSIFLPLALFGCGQDDSQADLDINSLPVITTADEKGDSPNAPSFFWVRPSTRDDCTDAPCPEADARQVNSQTKLPIYKLDWRGLGLSGDEMATVDAQLTNTLLFGKYTMATAFAQAVTVLQVTRIYVAASEASGDNPATDTYYSMMGLSTPCMGGSCPTLSATMLNNAFAGAIDLTAVDLSRLSSDPSFQSALQSELATGTDCVAITGIGSGGGSASQAFRPLGAPPLSQP